MQDVYWPSAAGQGVSVNPTSESSLQIDHEGIQVGHIQQDASVVSERRSTEWLWLFWDHRGLLWRAAICGVLLSVITAFVMPSRYQSTTQLMPPDGQSGSGMGMAIAAALAGSGGAGLSSFTGDLLGMKSSGALFTDILRSRTVADRLVNQFDLRRVYSDRLWEDARRDLAKRTAISEDRKSGVLTIAVTDRDPQRAAQIAQAYVDELDRLVAEVSTSSARRERIFIEQRLKAVQQDLDSASRQFSEYASRNTTIDISTQGKATVEAAARLQGEMIAAQSELQGLEQIYSTNNVRVRSVRARVEELRRQLRKIGGSDSPPAIVPEAGGSESQAEFPSIRQLPLLGVRWAELYRQTKVEETVYELLTQQYELAKIQEAKAIPTVKILDAANIPETRSSPRRLQIMFFGTMLALAAGVGWILANRKWQQLDPEDSRKQLALEVLGKLQTSAPWFHQNGSAWIGARRGPSHVPATKPEEKR